MESAKFLSKAVSLPQLDKKTNVFTQKTKGMTGFLNISTKLNGIGGSNTFG
jgi:hypothetical protein